MGGKMDGRGMIKEREGGRMKRKEEEEGGRWKRKAKGRKKRGKKNGNTTREGTHSVLFIVSAGRSVRVC